MIPSLILIAIALGGALFFLLRAVRGNKPEVRTPADITSLFVPVDVAGFRNLMSPTESAFLRRSLSARSFRRVQRSRQLAAAQYVLAVARNASVMMSMAEANLQNDDPEIAAAANTLARDALQLRMQALSALLRIYWCALFPWQTPAGSPIAEDYMGLSARAGYFVRRRFPSDASTVSHMF